MLDLSVLTDFTCRTTWQCMHACAVEHANITTCGLYCAEQFAHVCTVYEGLAQARPNNSRIDVPFMWGSLRLAKINAYNSVHTCKARLIHR